MEPLKDFVRQMPINDIGMKEAKRNNAARRGLDWPLLIMLFMLSFAGLFVLYSAAGQHLSVIYRQLAYLVVGFTAMTLIARTPFNMIRTFTPVIYICGCLLLLIVLIAGVGAKGAQRWIDLGVVRFQPSELVKLSVPLFVGWYLSKQNLPPSFKDILVVGAIIALPAALILKQPDLGTSILVAASGLFVLWIAGLSWRYIIGALIILAVAAPLVFKFGMHEYQQKRVMTFINPTADKLGSGWNTIQAKTAIGSGGQFGKGWLDGTQSQLDFLPESHTDFIVAVFAEEHGLVGVVCLMLLYLLIVFRSLYISWRAGSVFAQMVGGAISITFFVYVFVNMGMVSGILPVVGVPLPLISQGGTSLVSLLIGFGLIMSASNTHIVTKQERKDK